ncbi:MAG: metallophosphoesterase family protein [Verrucomicrobiales bacterium]
MAIAVLSDIHDHLDHLGRVLETVRSREVSRLCFLGDFCAPFVLKELADGFAGPIDAVFGNNDGDRFLLCRLAASHPHVTLHDPLAELEIDGRKILLTHYPEIGRRLAKSGEASAVFSGHDHQRYQHRFGDALWANPGEIMGRFGTVSFGLYHPSAHTFEHVVPD